MPTQRAGIIAKRDRRAAPSRKENGNAHLRRHRPGVELHSPCHLRSEGRSSQHLFQQGLQEHHQRQGDGWPCRVRGGWRVHARRRGPRRQRAEKPHEARALLRLQARRRVRHRRAAQRRELRRGRRGNRTALRAGGHAAVRTRRGAPRVRRRPLLHPARARHARRHRRRFHRAHPRRRRPRQRRREPRPGLAVLVRALRPQHPARAHRDGRHSLRVPRQPAQASQP